MFMRGRSPMSFGRRAESEGAAMRTEFAEQYSKCCVVIDGTESADDVIAKCFDDEATFFDGEDSCFVVQFPGRPQELYTENALRGSLPVIEGGGT